MLLRSFSLAAALLLAVPSMAADVEPLPGAAAAAAKPFVYAPKPVDILIGKPDAPVTVVEYASLSCPHCGHFYREVLPELTKKYIDTGKMRLVYRDYPLNDAALKAAELLQCADPKDRHTFLRVLFTTQNKWVDSGYKESLANIAALGGIPRAQYNTCITDKTVEKSIVDDAQEAQNDYKVESTPTFFINGEKHKGDQGVTALSGAIDKAYGAAKK